MAKTLTALAISAAIRDAKKTCKTRWLSDGSMPRGHGGLQLRVSPDGDARWYWRYSVGTKKVRIALGTYSAEKAPACLTLPEARQAALDKAALYQNPESRDVRAHLEQEQQEREVKRLAEIAAAELAAKEAALAGERTLLKLMDLYQGQLKAAGKQSAKDVRYLIDSHIKLAHPTLAATPASEITPDEVNKILRALVSAGKGRTAAKLRSYMRAAYEVAMKARLDSSASQELVDFGIQFNPVAQTGGLSQYNKALDRALTLPELRLYWGRLQQMPDGAMRDALMLALLLGGQRPAQLVRVKVIDIDLSACTVTMRDSKGKRKQPRIHTVPLCDEALEVVVRCLKRAEKQESQYLLSTHGEVPIRTEQLAKIVTKMSTAMLEDESIKTGFQLRDLRRTAETLLAGEGFAQEVLARLLSHGLGGIQNKHYNKYSYTRELKAALTQWEKLITNSKEESNVIQLKVGAA